MGEHNSVEENVHASGYVQYWDMKNLSYSFLEQRAAERGIDPANVSNATLQVILALWEYGLPRNDPMRTTLVAMLGMTNDQMKEHVDVAGYWTKRDMVHRFITVRLLEDLGSSGAHTIQTELKRREAPA
ncbi:hypothetical protein PG988_004932 [Apiospora saccharicola]